MKNNFNQKITFKSNQIKKENYQNLNNGQKVINYNNENSNPNKPVIVDEKSINNCTNNSSSEFEKRTNKKTNNFNKYKPNTLNRNKKYNYSNSFYPQDFSKESSTFYRAENFEKIFDISFNNPEKIPPILLKNQISK